MRAYRTMRVALVAAAALSITSMEAEAQNRGATNRGASTSRAAPPAYRPAPSFPNGNFQQKLRLPPPNFGMAGTTPMYPPGRTIYGR